MLFADSTDKPGNRFAVDGVLAATNAAQQVVMTAFAQPFELKIALPEIDLHYQPQVLRRVQRPVDGRDVDEGIETLYVLVNRVGGYVWSL